MNQNKFLTIAFALILLIPSLDSIFNFSPIKDLFEKRIPVENPQFSWSVNYPKKFEEFFNDNYGMRKSLIYLNSKILDGVFAQSPDARAVEGVDGWLYFDNNNSLLDAAGKADLSDDLIARGVESFYQNWQMLKAKNIDYLLVIAADKSTIYPEFLPSFIKPAKTRRIDKFLESLTKKYPDFPVLDLRPILISAKEHEVIYHKTDTHWNKRGAHYGYVALMKKLVMKFHPRTDFSNKEDEFLRGDISDIMGIDSTNLNLDLSAKFKAKSQHVSFESSDKYLSHFHKAHVFVNENQNLPRLFAYRDSFFNDLSVLVSEHFSRSLYVNEFPCDLNFAEIKIFHPHLVIQQFWEGRIQEVLTKCAQK